MLLTDMKLNDYLNRSFHCQCRRTHQTTLNTIELNSGALNKLPEVIHRLKHQKVFLVADQNTMAAAGETVYSCLAAHNIPCTVFLLKGTDVIPDEAAVGSVLMAYDNTCDLIVAVGSGTINDICRFTSYKLGLPYFIIPTAPSMDGLASTVSAMITNNMKTTYSAQVPEAIIADTDILLKAPAAMIGAGFGDILGKYTCLTDWKLSAVIGGEYYCDNVMELTTRARNLTISCKDGLQSREESSITSLTEALILSGIAMSFTGNSRPASGSEHHLSHFWEMRFLFEGKKPVLHGIKVGIGTVVSLKLYELLQKTEIDFSRIKSKKQFCTADTWNSEIRRTYLAAADEVIRLEETTGKNSSEKWQKRIDSIREHWDEIRLCMKALPSVKEAEHYLTAAGCPTRPSEIGLDRDIVKDSILYAKELRDRYTILQLLWDLDLLEAFAEETVNYLFS